MGGNPVRKKSLFNIKHKLICILLKHVPAYIWVGLLLIVKYTFPSRFSTILNLQTTKHFCFKHCFGYEQTYFFGGKQFYLSIKNNIFERWYTMQ